MHILLVAEHNSPEAVRVPYNGYFYLYHPVVRVDVWFKLTPIEQQLLLPISSERTHDAVLCDILHPYLRADQYDCDKKGTELRPIVKYLFDPLHDTAANAHEIADLALKQFNEALAALAKPKPHQP
jgi:hypothetical protein